jgi:1-phosphatidylinositol-4-phosphate 5-kinase
VSGSDSDDEKSSTYSDKELENRIKLNSLKRRATMKYVNKKQQNKNISVYFGHPNWNLILNMMIGMRKSLKSLPPDEFDIAEMKKDDFKTKHIHDILPERTQHFDFRKVYHFIDYAPIVFMKIRKLFIIYIYSKIRSRHPQLLEICWPREHARQSGFGET